MTLTDPTRLPGSRVVGSLIALASPIWSALAILPTPTDAQTIAEISRSVEEAVFQVIGEYADGTGFLVDHEAGLVLTNAHVTSGADSVGVRLNALYKVTGRVVHEDSFADIAVLKVSSVAVEGRPSIRIDTAAYIESEVGDPVVVLGYPLRKGVVTTSGIIGRKGVRTLLMDANVNPGNSGGPVLDQSGRAIGLTTFLAARGAAAGLGGAMNAEEINASLGDWSNFSEVPSPGADSLQVMPVDDYPIEALRSALSAEEWPTQLYELSRETAVRQASYSVQITTPALLVRSAGEFSDLNYWSQEIGGHPPVVILRVYPRVGQSSLGFVANLLLGAVASIDSYSYFPPIHVPEAKGRLSNVRLQDQSGVPVAPIQVKRAAAEIDGQRVQVMHLVYPAHLFQSNGDGEWQDMIINIDDAEDGLLPWVIPSETVAHVYADFQEYLALQH